jgi:ribosomal protein L28
MSSRDHDDVRGHTSSSCQTSHNRTANAMFPSFPVFSVVSQPFKRSQLGLFQGKTKQYGNNVPFSKHKTRRTWLPNVQYKRLFSETLGENVRVKITTRALRTIKKVSCPFQVFH